MNQTSKPSSPPSFTLVPAIEPAPGKEQETSAQEKNPQPPQKRRSRALAKAKDGSQPLPIICQEKFAQAVASGINTTEAYYTVFGREKATHRRDHYRTREKPHIARRIEFLQKELAAKGLITREEVLKMLVDTIRAKPSEATMDNPLCEKRVSHNKEFAVFMDKMKAIERLCKMMGWDAPEKVEHSGVTHGEVYVLTEERRRILMEKKQRAMEANRAGRN